MSEFEIVEVKTITKDEEIAALREALAVSNKRAQIAERQLNDVVMAASIKLATARMLLSRVREPSGLLSAAIQGVLDVLPNTKTPATQRSLK